MSSYYSRMAALHGPKESRPSSAFVDDLARRASSGDRGAMEELNEQVLAPLAHAMAKRYGGVARSRHVDADDLRQEAMAAMLGALSGWMPEKGAFRTRAFALARFACLDLINSSHVVSMPVTLAEEVRMGRTRPQYSGGTRAAAALAMQSVMSLDYTGHGDSDDSGEAGSYGERLLIEEAVDKDFERMLNLADLRIAFRRGSFLLTNRQRYVLWRRLGLGGEGPRTIRELAQEEGVSPQWIGKLIRDAIGKLQVANGKRQEDDERKR